MPTLWLLLSAGPLLRRQRLTIAQVTTALSKLPAIDSAPPPTIVLMTEPRLSARSAPSGHLTKSMIASADRMAMLSSMIDVPVTESYITLAFRNCQRVGRIVQLAPLWTMG